MKDFKIHSRREGPRAGLQTLIRRFSTKATGASRGRGYLGGLGAALGIALITGCISGGSRDSSTARLTYPATRKTNVVDDYHGVKVADPYRWLEDDNSPETRAWVEAENKVTFGYLQTIPELPDIKARLTKLWNYERYGVPFRQGGRYFFSKNNGLQNQSVLYTMATLDAEPSVLLDPNTLSADGTVALKGYDITEDGNLMAYALSTAGSDWEEIRVRDVRTARDLPDLTRWVKFSGISWTKDGKGYFYSRYDEPTEETKLTKANYFHKLYYHRLGAPQSEDKLVYQRSDHKDWNFNGSVTDDGHYLVITASEGTDPKNRVLYQDLQRPDSPVVELLMDFDADYTFIDNDGPRFWFRTDLNAPRHRVIAIDVTHPERANWKEIIPEAKETLGSVGTLNDRFVCVYLKDAHSEVKIFGLDGALVRGLALPGIGSVGGFAGKRSDTETFYSFTSFTVPGTIFRYDVKSGANTVFREPKVAFNPGDYETRQIFYASKDGTRVPMFITHKKGLKLNGKNPTLLYGYGGFDISLTPGFSVANLVWMEMGGVYAVPNLRGGGEYGEEWHQAGMKSRKQNVFDDFIAAAEWLIANKYTRPDKLAISGGSNGGLLVGACETQRPELFGAALPAVGVMDMLRFQKFTIGWAWTSDYGSSDNAEEFKALHAYSPLHHIKPGTRYPATLITTADHDDRVVPAHSFKYAATLQAAQAGTAPILIRIETRAGHGAGKPTTKIIEETAQRWAFLLRELKIKLPGGRRSE
ncbi:MAG TPA: prolyl oligopeptidase family serine peptidase [Candidatus Angelobacter sp.]|nr:prolyl oligopeptidase family serine peptidase [Candidatus Angelobacter sp.]